MTRSSVALANSAASSTPRSMAGTMSAGAICTADTPIAVKRSTARPEVRNLRPFRSPALRIGFLNQPSGSHGTGPKRKLLMSSCAAAWISTKSSLPPPYSTHAMSWFASMPKSGPAPYRPKAVFLPYQNAARPWPPSSVPLLTASTTCSPGTTAPAGSMSIFSRPWVRSKTFLVQSMANSW